MFKKPQNLKGLTVNLFFFIKLKDRVQFLYDQTGSKGKGPNGHLAHAS